MILKVPLLHPPSAAGTFALSGPPTGSPPRDRREGRAMLTVGESRTTSGSLRSSAPPGGDPTGGMRQRFRLTHLLLARPQVVAGLRVHRQGPHPAAVPGNVEPEAVTDLDTPACASTRMMAGHPVPRSSSGLRASHRPMVPTPIGIHPARGTHHHSRIRHRTRRDIRSAVRPSRRRGRGRGRGGASGACSHPNQHAAPDKDDPHRRQPPCPPGPTRYVLCGHSVCHWRVPLQLRRSLRSQQLWHPSRSIRRRFHGDSMKTPPQSMT